MTDLVIHTWQCDGCRAVSFRPTLKLDHKAPNPKNHKLTIHICEKCAFKDLVICLQCGHVHRVSLPCAKWPPIYQLEKDLL